MRDNSDRSHKKQFTNGGNGFVNLAKAWKNLPEEEKEVYRKPYQEELAEERIRLPSKSSHRNKMRKMCPFDLPRSPLEIWIAEEKKLPNKEAVTYKEWKQKFQNLEKEDKLKHIITSLREFYEYKKSADEYVEKNPDFVFPIIQGPNKSDVQLFLEYRRMPMLPPTRPTMMYYHELQKAGELDQFSGSEKLVVAMERYKNLPSSRKLHYKSLLDKKMEKYRMQMDAWEENQDELTLFMRARLLGRKIKKTENPKKTAPSASTRRQLLKPSEAFENTIKFEMSIPKFLDEPCKPPKNPFMLFRMKLKHLVQDKCESQSQVSNVCLKEWKNLSKEEKQRYTERCEELKEKYAEQVLQYVKNMNKNLRRLYVGVHRKTLFTFFQRDIFEEVYPNKKYPVYLLSPRKQKTVRKTSEDNFSGEVSDDDFTADSFSGKNNNKNVEFKKNENKSDSLQSKDKLSSDGYVKSKAVEGTSQSDAAKSKSKKGKEISAPTVSMFETKVKYLGTKTLDSFSSDDDQRIQDANVKTFEEESTKTESDSECDIERSQSPYKGSAEASLTTIPNKLESDDCSSSDGYSHTHVMPARKTTKSIRKKV
nr:nucleolar transcription factor 1-A-like [Cherax quadricarinatus]